MKRLAWTAIAALALGSVATAMCPYTTVFFQYGTSYAPTANMGPILNGQVNGAFTCGVTIDLNVQQPCGHCGQYVATEFLIVGLNQVNLPVSGGGSLYVSPDILIPLPPQIGSTLIVGDMPATPSLIGTSIYMQGALTRISTFGAVTDIETSNGLEMRILP